MASKTRCSSQHMGFLGGVLTLKMTKGHILLPTKASASGAAQNGRLIVSLILVLAGNIPVQKFPHCSKPGNVGADEVCALLNFDGNVGPVMGNYMTDSLQSCKQHPH